MAATAPDQGVGSPSVTDSSPAEGGSFTLSATVSNVGRRSLGGHNAALLPLDGRDDFDG